MARKLRDKCGWKEGPHGTFKRGEYRIVHTPGPDTRNWYWEVREVLESGRVERLETPSGKGLRFASAFGAIAFFELLREPGSESLI